MKLKNIDIHIFKILIANKKITLNEIVKIYSESEVNIKTSLNRLNNFLVSFNYGHISKKDTVYSLHLISNKKPNKSLNNFPVLSSKERINYFLIILAFEKKIKLCSVAKYFDVTRNTLSSDIKTLKNKLLNYNLTLDSIPWKGLYLKGEARDIYIFSIKTILKFLVKKESNQLVYNIYENLINPTIKDYYDKHIPPNLDYEFKKLSVEILRYFHIEIDLYGANTLKAIFIFLTLNKNNNTIFKNSLVFLKNFKQIEKLYIKTLNKLLTSKLLDNNEVMLNNIDFIVISLILLQKKLLFLEVKKNTPSIIIDLEDLFNLKFSTFDKVEFLTLLDISKFNYEYDIYNYHKIPKERFKFPELLVDVLKEYSIKHHYKILPQDFYILAHFLYNLIFNTYLKILINKKILILDYSNNNWIGSNIKTKLSKNFKFKNIDILSIYMLDFFSTNVLESYDFIIYSFYSDTTTLPTNLVPLKDKLIILDYLDYFEASYLVNKILFNRYLDRKKAK
ncbi:MAG: hypothetical protein ACRDDK_00420 [Cetobacterium sp.]